jgi:hypothetical protein
MNDQVINKLSQKWGTVRPMAPGAETGDLGAGAPSSGGVERRQTKKRGNP